MWVCPDCKRRFKKSNQSHSCNSKTVGEIFMDKSDALVLAYDAISTTVMNWQPNTIGAAVHSIVFTNKKAWLIIKPMKKELDVKFYCDVQLDDELLHKTTYYYGKYAHHIRIKSAEEITNSFYELLKKGFDFGMGN